MRRSQAGTPMLLQISCEPRDVSPRRGSCSSRGTAFERFGSSDAVHAAALQQVLLEPCETLRENLADIRFLVHIVMIDARDHPEPLRAVGALVHRDDLVADR